MAAQHEEGSIFSSQNSMSDLVAADKENILLPPSTFSSPTKHDSSQKPRRPPTVTPKRFSRFFTPRSSLSAKNERRSKSGRQLRDITRSSINQASEQYRLEVDRIDFDASRSPKRRRRLVDIPSSPPQASPLKAVTFSPHKQVHVLEDDVTNAGSSDEDDDDDLSEDQPCPNRIRRLQQGSPTQHLLGRSFGGRPTTGSGSATVSIRVRPHNSTASFCSGPLDVASFYRGQKALPFATAACNTNSLVSVGDEEGIVHLFDSAPDADFPASHLTFRVHSNAIFDLAFSPCDYVLASASGDQTARIVDMQTQTTISVLAGHTATVRQVRFHPDDSKLITTSGRDGFINIWDLRCAKTPVKLMRYGPERDIETPMPTLYPYAIMAAGPAHRACSAAEKIVKLSNSDHLASPSQVSITSIEHLPGSRSHLLLTASEQNASLKLFDLRIAGRNSKGERPGFEIPVSSTSTPNSHFRNHGVTSLALSSDGARVFSACRDSTVWVYSTQHLVLGSAPEMLNLPKRTRHALPDKPKQALDPLYGLRHPSLKINSFYVKAAIRKATTDSPELLAVGSREQCAILFSTDEQSLQGHPDADLDCPRSRLRSQTRFKAEQGSGSRIFNSGTALIRGHTKDVGSLTFTQGGELITIGDDYKARCWREDADTARQLRQGGEGEGNRWASGWADVPSSFDDDDV